MTYKKVKKVKKCFVLKCWMLSFEDWRLLLYLGQLHEGLKINILQFLIKNNIFYCKFLLFLLITSLDSDPDPH